MRLNFSFLLLLLVAGCVTAPPTGKPPHLTNTFPADALITQRGVLTVHGRQFAVNGYVAVSAAGGVRLIMTESFGHVLADVLLKPDGSVHLMRQGQLLKPAWIKRYVAADLNCLFGNAPGMDCPGRRLSPTHFIIERPAYTLDLQTVATKPGVQSPEMFDATQEVAP